MRLPPHSLFLWETDSPLARSYRCRLDLTVSVQNTFISEFVASQTYIWIMMLLYNLAEILIRYEKAN